MVRWINRAGASEYLIAIAALILLRFIAGAVLPLSADEAYYWLWSKHLAAGYYDHPPAIAFLIRAGTLIFGDTAFGVRVVPLLTSVAAKLVRLARGYRDPQGGACRRAVLPAVQSHLDGRGRDDGGDAGRTADRGLRRLPLGDDEARRGSALVACGWRRGRSGAAVEIHGLLPGAGRARLDDLYRAALVPLAVALSRRDPRLRDLRAEPMVERDASLDDLRVPVRTRRHRTSHGAFPVRIPRRPAPARLAVRTDRRALHPQPLGDRAHGAGDPLFRRPRAARPGAGELAVLPLSDAIASRPRSAATGCAVRRHPSPR